MFRIVLTEGDSSRVIEIGDRTVIRIGRDPASDVVIRDRFVSARHGEIRVAPEGLRYEDFVTTNGSRIRRGERVLPVDGSNFHVVPIFPGDKVRVHGEPIVVGFGESAVFDRTATVERATAIERLWTKFAGHFEMTELYEVSFTSRRTA